MARTLFVGDVHGCAEPLERLLEKTDPTRVILLGDLFTRGPDPRGVWRLIRRWEAEAVLGNHDEHVLRSWKAGRELPRAAFEWLEELPLVLKGNCWAAVHAGLHPKRGLENIRRRDALHLRRLDDRQGRPHWWREYRGRRLVLHGHDASRGLVDRRPWSLGLDTGCVRGRRLSGYLLEADELVSVRAGGV